VNEQIDIRSRTSSINREKFVSLDLAWQTTAKVLKLRKQASKEMQCQVQKLLTEYNIRFGSPPVTHHDRVLLYAFRTAWMLYHRNILAKEIKKVSETLTVLKT
jgi:hypothetical protein